MSLQALDDDTPAPITKKKTRQRRISKPVIDALELLATGECSTVKAAAVRVGITREWLSKQLGEVHVQAFISRRNRKTIAVGSMRASNRVLELIDAQSEHVSLDASKHVLAIEGIRPPNDAQHVVNVGVSVGYVIDLSGKQVVTVDSASPANDGQVIDNVETGV